MLCKYCQHQNPTLAKFCEDCGSAMPRQCKTCGHELAPAAKFCIECGTAVQFSVPPSSQALTLEAADNAGADRRYATVLFADITGYTALCARSDPEQVREMLARFFNAMDEVVEAHGGSVIDRAGDAIMAVFGAPVAHGNDSLRAVRAALSMHAAAGQLPDCDGKPLCLHIGVASGEVVAAAIGGGGKSKYSVTGDPVNLAARLDALAAPGETLISDALYRDVASAIDAEARGEQPIKGLAASVEVWRVHGLREARLERLPFVGRQAEMRQLVGMLDAALETGCGSTLLVRGDAGIGKSRLVDEFRALARERGFETPSGQVLDFGVGKGQDAVPTVLKALLRSGPLDDAAMRGALLQGAIQRGWIEGDEVLFVNEWIDLPQPESLAGIFAAMDNATRLRRSSETLAALLQRVAGACPQLVLIEDVHWGSPELLRHLAALTRAAAQAPIILLLTTRIEGDPLDKAWRASTHGSAFMTLDLGPLRPQEARLLAAGLVEASSRFALGCIERAEGNPLFLEQLLRASHGMTGASPDVPPTIRSLVLERMDRLPAPQRAALQVAAAIGKRFSLGDLRGIANDAGMNCDGLVAADLVRPEGVDFLFAHALIQEAVYASTLKSRRREIHLTAARWFSDGEPVLHAEHLERADDPGAPQAYLRAARQEAASLRFEPALRLAQRGRTLAEAAAQRDDATACELALLEGESLAEVGRSSDSIVVFRAALDLAGEDQRRCRAWMGVAAGYRITGDFEAAMEALGHAEPLAQKLELTIARSRMHHTRGNLFFSQGLAALCEAEHVLALQCAQECGDVECQARALSGLGDAQYAQGRMRTALDYFRRCVAACEGRISISVPNRCMIGHCLWYLNDLSAAIAEAQSARDDAERVGVVPVQVFAQATVTQLLTEAGRFEDAEIACERALALARSAGSRRYESTLLLFSAEHKLRRGEDEGARQDLSLGLDLARQTGLGFIGAALHGRLARVASRSEERAQCLADGAALLRSTSLAHSHLWFYRDAIEASLAAGVWADALLYADSLEGESRDEPLPWVALMAERARAIVGAAQRDNDEAAMLRLQRVRETAVAAGNGWGLARIDAALGVHSAR